MLGQGSGDMRPAFWTLWAAFSTILQSDSWKFSHTVDVPGFQDQLSPLGSLEIIQCAAKCCENTHQKHALVILPLWIDLVIKKIKLKHPKPKRSDRIFLWHKSLDENSDVRNAYSACSKHATVACQKKKKKFFGMLLLNSKLFVAGLNVVTFLLSLSLSLCVCVLRGA